MKIGDTVKLIAGGPPMTIVHCSPMDEHRQTVTCLWFTIRGDLRQDVFFTDTLKKSMDE